MEKFSEKFDEQVSKDEIQSFIEYANKIDDKTFNEIIAGIDRIKFEKLISKISVGDFIKIINKMNGVTVLADDKKDVFIKKYLEKMRILLEDRKRKNIDSTINFLRENLNNNVKYIVYVTYTQEEKEIKDTQHKGSDVDKSSTIYNSASRKTAIGAAPGQYIQGRIVYSNLPQNDILKYHETTHAARTEFFDKNGNKIEPVSIIDDLNMVNNFYSFLRQFPNTNATAGYDFSEVDEQSRISGENDGPEPLEDHREMSDLMEICTESIAGLVNNHDNNNVMRFENFWVPQRTMEMSAISFFRDARDLLILAIGSDDFIFDMLEPNSRDKIEHINKEISQYKDGASIAEYFKIAGEHATLEGRIEQNIQKEFVKKRRDNYSEILDKYKAKGDTSSEEFRSILEEFEKCKQAMENAQEENYVENRKNEYRYKMESYATDIFLSRMKKCEDKDKDSQIEFFLNILKCEKIKERVKTNNKNKLVELDDVKDAYRSTSVEGREKLLRTVRADVAEKTKEGEKTYE